MKAFHTVLISFFVFLQAIPVHAEEPDSLLTLLNVRQGEEKIEVLNELSFFYVDRQPSVAKSYSLQAVDLVDKTSNDSLSGAVFRALGNSYRTMGRLDSAEFFLKKAIGFFGTSEAKRAQAVCSYSLSVIYLDRRRHDLALKALQPAMDYFREFDHLTYVSIVPAMAMILTDMKQPESAIKLLNETIVFNKESAEYDVIGEAFLRGNLGKALSDMLEPDIALAAYEFKLAAEIFRDNGLMFPLRTTLGDLANAYLHLGKVDSALLISKEALRISEELDHPEGKMLSHLSIAESHLSLNQPQKARYHLESALELDPEVEDPTARYEAYRLMAILEESVGDQAAAYPWMKKFASVKDSVYRKESLEELNDMQVRYETEQQERVLAEQELQLQEQQSQLIALGALGLILALLVVGGFYLYRARMQSRMQDAVILEQEKGFEAIFSAIEEERQRIAGDLHDGVGQQLTALNFGFQQLDLPPHEAGRLGELIRDVSRDVRELSHEMMPPSLGELGLVPAMKAALSQSLGSGFVKAEFEEGRLRDRYPELVEITTFRVFQELINNSLKHSGADAVGVQLFEAGGNLRLIVEDNGNGGLSLDNPGVGLRNMTNRLNLLNGRLEVESDPDHGTTVAVSIPV